MSIGAVRRIPLTSISISALSTPKGLVVAIRVYFSAIRVVKTGFWFWAEAVTYLFLSLVD